MFRKDDTSPFLGGDLTNGYMIIAMMLGLGFMFLVLRVGEEKDE